MSNDKTVDSCFPPKVTNGGGWTEIAAVDNKGVD